MFMHYYSFIINYYKWIKIISYRDTSKRLITCCCFTRRCLIFFEILPLLPTHYLPISSNNKEAPFPLSSSAGCKSSNDFSCVSTIAMISLCDHHCPAMLLAGPTSQQSATDRSSRCVSPPKWPPVLIADTIMSDTPRILCSDLCLWQNTGKRKLTTDWMSPWLARGSIHQINKKRSLTAYGLRYR